jgi:Sialidase, N-terminal domain.
MKTLLEGLVVSVVFFTYASTSDAANCLQIPGLVSWWQGESNAVDLVGGNSGVLLNGATFGPGKYGQAFSFDGTGAHVRVADNDSLHLTNGLTLTAWVNPTGLGYSYQIISKWDVVFDYQKSYATWLDGSGRLIFSVCANGDEKVGPHADLVSVRSVTPNQWTHVAATYDGSKMRVYLNGQLDSQTAFPYGIFPGTNDLAIGAIVGGVPAGQNLYPFSGGIDEPAIYNRALSPLEIQQIYLCQTNISLGLYPGLTINGSIGQNVAIQCITNITSSDWTTITTLAITQQAQLWIDTENNVSSGNTPRRFYRAVVVP